jgi:arylsulfatase A-like enzyme
MQKAITQCASTALVVSVLGAVASHAAAAAERPNVLVILTDDQGWGDLSVHGNTNLSTPHVDSLARDGARFERFYVCPVCSPTRSEFLTGRYHPRSGVHQTSKGGERMDLDEATIADAFKAAAYATACFGKWHNGAQYPYHPNGRGFDEFYGFTSGHYADYYSPPLDHNGEIVRGNGYLTDDFTDKAITFIEKSQRQERPFFAYVAYNTPHSPMQVPDRWWNKFKDKQLSLRGTNPDKELIEHTRAALAMCENVDWNVGRLLKKLDDLKIADNTIVVYFCDNGPNGNRWIAGLKGMKGTTDEGGIRSPLFIRWPAHIKAGTEISQIAGAIDLLPTLTELAGVSRVGDKPLDGMSLKRLLVAATRNGEDDTVPTALRDRILVSHWGGQTSATDNRFRLDHRGRLYDLLNDPGQRTDVSDTHGVDKARLTKAAKAWKKDALSELSEAPRPFPVGHPDRATTRLPAADGIGHGNVRWSSQHPNSSYFTDWSTIDDRITWDIEVLEPGEYTVEVFYTCPEDETGSGIVLRFKGSRLIADVDDPFDPPLIGAEHDRFRRGESYTKEFRPLKLGTMHLEKGRGEITLQALNITSSQVMDVQMIQFTRETDSTDKP